MENKLSAISNNFVPYSHLYGAQYSDWRTTLSVVPSQAIYANFAHITAVPASDGTAGISIDKLQILNSLINELQRLRSQSSISDKKALPIIIDDKKSSQNIDFKIAQYSKEIKDLSDRSADQKMVAYSSESSITAPGSIFSLSR